MIELDTDTEVLVRTCTEHILLVQLKTKSWRGLVAAAKRGEYYMKRSNVFFSAFKHIQAGVA